jgi:hypothetical protein
MGKMSHLCQNNSKLPQPLYLRLEIKNIIFLFFSLSCRTISFIIGWLDSSYINTIHQEQSKAKVEELLQEIIQSKSVQEHLQKRYCS